MAAQLVASRVVLSSTELEKLYMFFSADTNMSLERQICNINICQFHNTLPNIRYYSGVINCLVYFAGRNILLIYLECRLRGCDAV
jgi:hypothetical protein